MRLLLVEDEEAMADALVYLLLKENYQVDVAYDGITGEDYASTHIYDGIILDRMLPGKEGTALLKAIRGKQIKTPTMFLTAKDTVEDRVEGLDAGADDYLIKPFSNKEFLARVRALTRRSKSHLEEEILTVKGLSLNRSQCTYKVRHQEGTLTKTEAQLLELLMRNKGQVLKKEQILDRIWGFDKEVEIANVELYIFYLRKKVKFLEAGVNLNTIRGMGYSLVEVTYDS